MQGVLIDLSALLDLVLSHQDRHRRSRSIASSAAAALEALVLYEQPFVDGLAFHGILETSAAGRFLQFYCDHQADTAIEQLRQLGSFCEVLPISGDEDLALAERAVRGLEEIIGIIANPDELRAYELYDYLPYHLGEDPTAIECRVTNPSVADLEFVDVGGNGRWSDALARAANLLKDRRHPTRAAWALPLLRFLYYQALQESRRIHFVPHATKSTVAFGREAETVAHRRLLDYCTEEFRSTYLALAERRLAGMLLVPIAAFADLLLRKTQRWGEVVTALARLRDEPAIVGYRRSLTALIEELEKLDSLDAARPAVEEAYRELESHCRRLGERFGVASRTRRLRVGLSFFQPADQSATCNACTFLLLHDLFSATGIAGSPYRS